MSDDGQLVLSKLVLLLVCVCLIVSQIVKRYSGTRTDLDVLIHTGKHHHRDFDLSDVVWVEERRMALSCRLENGARL